MWKIHGMVLVLGCILLLLLVQFRIIMYKCFSQPKGSILKNVKKIVVRMYHILVVFCLLNGGRGTVDVFLIMNER